MDRRWYLVLAATYLAMSGGFYFISTQNHTTPPPVEPADVPYTLSVPAGESSDKIVVGNSTLYELDRNSGWLLGKCKFDSPICSKPEILNGVTYVATLDGALHAVKDGLEKWKTALADTNENVWKSLVVVKIYDDRLIAFNPDKLSLVQLSSGKILNQFEDVVDWQVAAGKLYLCTRKELLCVDLESAKTIWTAKEQFDRDDGGAMLVHNGALYMSHYNATYKFDAETGRVLWKNKDLVSRMSEPILAMPGNQIYGAGTGVEGSVLFNCDSGKYCRYSPGEKVPIQTNSDKFTNSSITSAELVGNMLYVSGSGPEVKAYVACLDPKSHSQKWIIPINEPTQAMGDGLAKPAAAPVIRGNQMLIQMDNSIVHAINIETRKLLWKSRTNRLWGSDLNQQESTAISIFGDDAIVYDPGGITVLDLKTGKEKWGLDFNGAVSHLQDANKLYFETHEGAVLAIDVKTHKVDWTFSVDGAKPDAAIYSAACQVEPIPFSPEAWKTAKNAGPNWSRQKLMDQFLQQYGDDLRSKFDRTKILQLLGQPDLSRELLQFDEKTSRVGSTIQETRTSFPPAQDCLRSTMIYKDHQSANFGRETNHSRLIISHQIQNEQL